MQKKRVIQLLPDQVINKIAAGEVVERPASVVKELFENALDAGATQVDIEIVQGGRQLISITDNGCGMSRDQALLSIERHATSKIQSEADIENISTLGFRGEALAAIASVSRFTLTTRPAEELAGTELQITGGKMSSVEEVGCPVGTRMEIRNLFFNVPARRKFLRAEQTELSHIRQLFLVHALAHPDIGMSLNVDGRESFRLPATSKLEDRISEIYDTGFLEQLLPISYKGDEYKITGYAGLPQTGRSDRQDQYIFINGRPASAPVIQHALNEAYRSLVARGRYPALFLFITMEPSLVDVNVHPTKKEVRFRRPNQLRDAVANALGDALTFQSFEQVQTDAAESVLPETPSSPRPAVRPRFETQGEISELLVRPDAVTSRPKSQPATDFKKGEQEMTTQDAPEKIPVSTLASHFSTTPWGRCRIVGEIGDSYVALETEDGFVLMEPRAAHERVLFEKFMTAANAQKIEKQGLLTPVTVELLPADAQLVRDNLASILSLGFGISEFGGDSFIVDALPVYVQQGSAREILIDIARELEQSGKKNCAEKMLQEKIAQTACYTAVRAKDKLSREEIEQLVSDLAKTEMPYTSPRGRPTLIYISFTELHRKFNRD